MEQERILIDPTRETDEMPPRPHFDEEATLLTARPVVPLKQVGTRTHRRRTLSLAMALVTALLLGAGSALVIDRLNNAEKPQAAAGVDTGSAHPNKQDSNASNDSGFLGYANEKREESTDTITSSSAISKVGRQATLTPATEDMSSGTGSVASSALRGSQERSSRADLRIRGVQHRREEQRDVRRRRWERELDRQRDSNRATRDLFRIREIFEGQNPPD